MPKSAEPTFEEQMDRLEALVRELEGGGLPLEKALARYEEAVKLARGCRDRLEATGRRVEELLADGSTRRLAVD